MPKRIPIKVVREFARKYSLTHVVMLAHDGERDHVVTYGKTIEQCSQAADFGNKLKDDLGWPKSLHAQPSRVKKLEKKIKILEDELSEAHELLAGEEW